MEIYTCIKGEVITGNLVNETLQGFRVTGGKVHYDHIVFKSKLRTGWLTEEQKPYFTEKSFKDFQQAKEFSFNQLIAMHEFYSTKLLQIKWARKSLEESKGVNYE